MSTAMHLAIRGAGIHLHAALQPDCLPELLALIQKYRVDEPVGFDPERHERREGGRGRFGRRLLEESSGPVEPLSDAAVATKQRLGDLTQDALAAMLPSLSMGDKLLLLIGWLEVKSPLRRKSDLRDLFAQLKEPAPANPGRDIKNLMLDGLIRGTQDRKGLFLLEQGWQRLGGLLSDGEGDGNPVLA